MYTGQGNSLKVTCMSARTDRHNDARKVASWPGLICHEPLPMLSGTQAPLHMHTKIRFSPEMYIYHTKKYKWYWNIGSVLPLLQLLHLSILLINYILALRNKGKLQKISLYYNITITQYVYNHTNIIITYLLKICTGYL